MPDTTIIAMVVDDMFFASKIRSTAEAAGGKVETVRSIDGLREKARDNPPGLVIIDLNSNRLNPIEAVQLLKSDPNLRQIPIVGFLSHVQVDLQRAAQEAGCDYVIPRSIFSMRLAEIVGNDLSGLTSIKH
jgi:two-component system sensor histidine kinase and response regulator WspE